MPSYEFGRIQYLANQLAKFGVSPEIIGEIMEGGEEICNNAKPEKKSAWFKEAMNRMDRLMDEETRRAVRESCACCLGGERLKISKSIAKNYESLEDRVAAANEAKRVVGHSATLLEDGRIKVQFAPDGQESYGCVCMRKVELPVSETYCYCCGGHIKHHMQIALGRKLKCEVNSTALTSAGKTPCSFFLEFLEAAP